MGRNFHESYAQEDVKPPSERSTGLVFAAVAAIVAVMWRDSAAVLWASAAVGVGLLAVSLLAPAVLRPLNILWFRLSLALHRVTGPVIMLLIFMIVFIPAGFVMRLWYDPLQSKRAAKKSTYWIERTKRTGASGSMVDQF